MCFVIRDCILFPHSLLALCRTELASSRGSDASEAKSRTADDFSLCLPHDYAAFVRFVCCFCAKGDSEVA